MRLREDGAPGRGGFGPAASPRVMEITRIFWEKATAAHVYCARGQVGPFRVAGEVRSVTEEAE
jgi:hypothetical protein